MTLKDLKDNRKRIINKMSFQGVPKQDYSIIMNNMIRFLNPDERPLKKNIDSLTNMMITKYYRESYKPSDEELDETQHRHQKGINLPSSLSN